MRRRLIKRLRHWVANRGWTGLFLEVLRQAKLRLRRKKAGGDGPTAAPVPEVHPFDEEHGVDTGGLVWSEAVGGGGKGEYWATGYYGIAPSVLWQALQRLALDWPEYTFVDIGCGKGRALMAAMRYPFRAVLGVELGEELAKGARENLDRFRADWRREMPAHVIAGDATHTDLPAGPLLLYLYHPFAAPVMNPFLEHVRQLILKERREVYLLYMNPELDRLLAKKTFLERLWQACFLLEEADAVADRFGSRQEYVSAYRFRVG